MAPLYKPPTRVTTSDLPYIALVTQVDPAWARDKFWEVEDEFSGMVFEANPYQRGAYNRLSSVYPVGAAYGGPDPLVVDNLAPTFAGRYVANEIPGLYQEIGTTTIPTPPPSYTAKAVHFDGATYLTLASLTAAVSPKLTVAWWFKAPAPNLQNAFFVIDPDNFVVPYFALPSGFLDIELAANPNPASVELQPSLALNDGNWHSVIVSLDANGSGPFPVGIYIDRVKQTAFNTVLNTGSTFNVLGNGLKCMIGWDDTDSGSFMLGDVADFRVMYGTSIVDGSGNISNDNLNLFTTSGNKPVDPSVATNALGVGAILFSGGASSFSNNQGTGGSFTVTGALADASTSPSN